MWVVPQIQVLLAIENSGQPAETDQTVLEALEVGAWYMWGWFGKASEDGSQAQRGTTCTWVSGLRSMCCAHTW